MTDRNFEAIKNIAYENTGIKLGDHKKNMVYGRLARRLRKLKISNFNEYCQLISRNDSTEMVDFINSITTNLTSFFRENHHFEFLHTTAFPALLRKNNASKRIRIWSAGCSTGEEPYSIAMAVKSFLPFKNWDVKVLATDLDSDVVSKARKGIYSIERIESIDEKYKKFFLFDQVNEKVKVKDDVGRFITFNKLNLLNEWPMKGEFDIIFCRNVVIYFDLETQKILFDRYYNILKKKSYLFIGHSESLHNVTSKFGTLGRTIYERLD